MNIICFLNPFIGFSVNWIRLLLSSTALCWVASLKWFSSTLILDSASAIEFCYPLMYSISKSNSANLILHLCSLTFRYFYLCNHLRGWWSLAMIGNFFPTSSDGMFLWPKLWHVILFRWCCNLIQGHSIFCLWKIWGDCLRKDGSKSQVTSDCSQYKFLFKIGKL